MVFNLTMECKKHFHFEISEIMDILEKRRSGKIVIFFLSRVVGYMVKLCIQCHLFIVFLLVLCMITIEVSSGLKLSSGLCRSMFYVSFIYININSY